MSWSRMVPKRVYFVKREDFFQTLRMCLLPESHFCVLLPLLPFSLLVTFDRLMVKTRWMS